MLVTATRISLSLFIFTIIFYQGIASSDQKIQVANQVDQIYLDKKMESCIELVNGELTKKFLKKGIIINNSVSELCNENFRNKAQSKATKFAIEIQKSKDMMTLKQCLTIVDRNYQSMRQIFSVYYVSNLRFTHVCDKSIK